MTIPTDTGHSVLIVEDEELIAWVLKSELERENYRVCASVNNGRAAIESATELHPDIILMDIRLKGTMDGIQAAQEITARQTGSRIIFMSGYNYTLIRERYPDQDMPALLEKPVQMDDLKKLLEK